MCTEGYPNNNDMIDGECFWGHVVQERPKKNGEVVEREQWMLLKYSRNHEQCFFVAESPELKRVSRSQCKSWEPINPPIKKPRYVA